MRLSQRVSALAPSATLAVTARVRELTDRGVDVIGFGVGEPDFDTPEPIKQAAIEALLSGRTKYAPVAGEPDARAVIARKLRVENGIECTPEHIVISAGAKHSIYLALQCLIDPAPPGQGQQVILPTPAWVSYRPMIELAGGEVVEVPAAIENEFRIVPAQLEEAMTDRTAAILINSPSNPCGTMYTPEELRALAAVLVKHPDIMIITDEIYEKLIFGGIKHSSLGALPEIADRVVTINGLSKAFAMTGWRIGYSCAPGADGVLARAMAKLQGQMTSNITSFLYPAIIEALEHGSDSVERMCAAFAARATLMYDLVTAMPEVRCPRPTGAFYLFPDVSKHFGRTSPGGKKIDSALSLAAAMLEEAHVAVVPGEDFGLCAGGHVRLSFACAPAVIEEGCRRMHEWLTKLR